MFVFREACSYHVKACPGDVPVSRVRGSSRVGQLERSNIMKKSQFMIIILVFFLFLLVSCKTTVELKAMWDPNTELDITHYNLYRYYQEDYLKINDDPIMHPTTSYKFTLKLSDDSAEALCFVVTAVDTSRNESGYSEPVCVEK